jgi:hypothetical protein
VLLLLLLPLPANAMGRAWGSGLCYTDASNATDGIDPAYQSQPTKPTYEAKLTVGSYPSITRVRATDPGLVGG